MFRLVFNETQVSYLPILKHLHDSDQVGRFADASLLLQQHTQAQRSIFPVTSTCVPILSGLDLRESFF